MSSEKIQPKKLLQIFTRLESSLLRMSLLPKRELNRNLTQFKYIDTASIDWMHFFELIVFVTFYSGFRAETVNNKANSIRRHLGNFPSVKKYGKADVNRLMKNKALICYLTKINACISNARRVDELKHTYTSPSKYLTRFGNLDVDDNLNALAQDLRKRFKYVGCITVNHLLMDLGLNVVKPDRVLCRIFFRLGLIKDRGDHKEVIQIARKMRQATGYSMKYIDLMFVYYGQVGFKRELCLMDGICLEKNPKCDICDLKPYCNYYQNRLNERIGNPKKH